MAGGPTTSQDLISVVTPGGLTQGEKIRALAVSPESKVRRALLMHFDHPRWIIYVIIGVHMCVDDTILFGTTTTIVKFNLRLNLANVLN